MRTSDFYFDLPEDLIAQTPLEDRSASRLMILDRKAQTIAHQQFRQLADFLKPGDCLVLNDTRVIPARIFGQRETGAAVEFLLLKQVSANQWQSLVKPGKKAKVGDRFIFGDQLMTGIIVGLSDEGTRIVEFKYEGTFESVLNELGTMPLPPYIQAQLDDQERYQTVYSKNSGSAAAPTAGLHFTEELLNELSLKGIEVAFLTLHVGLGTFRPVKAEHIHEHQMHAEFYQISDETAEKINQTKAAGNRVIAVGTTSARTLESTTDSQGVVLPGEGWTDIFIYPGYTFKAIDGMITNFHLPESTLIMLISALAGKDFVMEAYRTAVAERYRFFSFGDAMLIL